jgi:hypothetical protein
MWKKLTVKFRFYSKKLINITKSPHHSINHRSSPSYQLPNSHFNICQHFPKKIISAHRGKCDWKILIHFCSIFAYTTEKNAFPDMPSDIFHFCHRHHWVPVHKFTTIERTLRTAPSTCFINLLPIYQIFIKLKSFRCIVGEKLLPNVVALKRAAQHFSFAWKIKSYF